MNQRFKFWSFWYELVNKMLERSNSTAASSTCTNNSSTTAYMGYKCGKISCNYCRRSHSASQELRLAGGGGHENTRKGWTQKYLFLGPSYQELQDGHYKPVTINFAEAINLEDINEEVLVVSRSRDKSLENRSNDTNPKGNRDQSNYYRVVFEKNNSQIEISASSLNRGHSSKIKESSSQFSKSRSYDSKNSKSVKLRIDSDSWTTISASVKSSSTKKSFKIEKQRGGADDGCMSCIKRSSWFGIRKNNSSSHRAKESSISELIEDSLNLWEHSERNLCNKSSRFVRRHQTSCEISASAYFLQGFGPWSVHPGDRASIRRRSCSVVRFRHVDPELRLPVPRRQLATSVSLTNLSSACALQPMKGSFIFFWTPEYWYRPRTVRVAYEEVRRHLRLLQEFKAESKKAGSTYSQSSRVTHRRSTTSQLRRLLELEARVYLRELDSTTLAHQLTLLDRELFLRIPGHELRTIVHCQTARDAPNFGAWVAFAHRISCLMASEILAEKDVAFRARLIARLLGVARKCFDVGNFQSARSVWAGLQSPGIFRLKDTWTYVEVNHVTRYKTMKMLSEVFKSTNTVKYQDAWKEVERNPPMVPYVGDVLARALTSHDKDGCGSKIKRMQLHKRRKLDRKFKNQDEQSNLHRVIEWLEQCQRHAQAYDFPRHELTWEFLLKARYTEDRDNFFLSLQLEPSS